MYKILSFVATLALVVIAINLTYSNTVTIGHQAVVSNTAAPAKAEERVFPVLGRVTVTFDGYGSAVGFAVKDGDSMRVLRYDLGSMAANSGFQPQYAMSTVGADGKTYWSYVLVDKFK
jgi:hypothetical protein